MITRRGKPGAQIVPVPTPRKRIDATELRAITDRMTPRVETAGDFMRRRRDEERY